MSNTLHFHGYCHCHRHVAWKCQQKNASKCFVLSSCYHPNSVVVQLTPLALSKLTINVCLLYNRYLCNKKATVVDSSSDQRMFFGGAWKQHMAPQTEGHTEGGGVTLPPGLLIGWASPAFVLSTSVWIMPRGAWDKNMFCQLAVAVAENYDRYALIHDYIGVPLCLLTIT